MVQSKKKPAQAEKLKVTLTRSIFGRIPSHAECVKGLGLRRIRHSVVVDNNACTRGMIQKVSYLLKVEEA